MIRLAILPEGTGRRRRLAVAATLAFCLLALLLGLQTLLPEYAVRSWASLRWVLGEDGAGRLEARIFQRDGRRWLWGGQRDSQHFDVSRCTLDPGGLRYGLGREHFPALIEPTFLTAEEADELVHPTERVLLVRIGEDVRVYPLSVLQPHEVVNDEVGGVPLFAAYCRLADLGAVYDRRFQQAVLTFAVSGYTYADPEVWDGRDAFVLWDRDTESLWWPPVGRAVSGPLTGSPLRLLEQGCWCQTTWEQARSTWPDVRVLEPDQRFRPPRRWPRQEMAPPPSTQPDRVPSVEPPPRWGEQATLPPAAGF